MATPHRIAGTRLLEGFEQVVRNLQQQVGQIKGGTKRGALRACLLIQAESQAEVPVDTGALRASAYTIAEDTLGGFIVETGYRQQITTKDGKEVQSYGIWVHELLDVHHPVGKAKFLEDPLKRLSGQILSIVAEEARVG